MKVISDQAEDCGHTGPLRFFSWGACCGKCGEPHPFAATEEVVTDLEKALDAFWNAAYEQGQEQGRTDDGLGTAQAAEGNLRRIIASLAAPKNGQPVAWVRPQTLEWFASGPSGAKADVSSVDVAIRQHGEYTAPFYAAAPQRSPGIVDTGDLPQSPWPASGGAGDA